ncbi:hypothetical protein [Streptomyces canus]|uniref:hypothetical protein n=1 Tax=Streptomyces canus TaxID=58343 RepID=UPI002780D63D|nr:hypothetical protein [Streptomyces canus]MDQ1070517.1 hypothetical protein [Streptomyces canus]
MTAEHDGLDALMAAITDEPPPESAAADPAFLADHRSAQDDVALLREQLRIIAETLTEAAPAAKPVALRPSRARHRARTFAFGTLAVAAVASVVTGLGWLLGHSGADNLSSADSGSSKAESAVRFGSPSYLACAATVAEGEVTVVKELPTTGELQVTVHVTRSYKPTRALPNLTYVITEYDLPEPLAKGTRVLFGVPQGSPSPDHWVVGEQEIARERAWITASLPASRGLTC